MAKAPTRSRGKKKLQDVMESIPDNGEGAVTGTAAENNGPPAENNSPPVENNSPPAETTDESQFVETEGLAAPAAEPVAAEAPVAAAAATEAPPREPGKKQHHHKRSDFDDGSPIDRETHEKYERIKRGELHITDLQKMAVAELHEVARIEQINKKLKDDFSLDLNDFLLKVEKTDSGESLPMKFVLTHGDEVFEVASLGDICPAVRHIGGKGIDIKRFKGLGEMNAEQLWETTMNPQTRTLLQVRLDDAGEADRLFSVLMGDDVEGRRRYIQDHALEVQNLDI